MNDDFAFATGLIQTDPWPIAQQALVIAEVGINHNGDVRIAKQLIDLANQTGCDAVKFQKRTIDIVYTEEMLDAPRESPWGTTQRQQKEGLEFGQAEYDEIEAYCRALASTGLLRPGMSPASFFSASISSNMTRSPRPSGPLEGSGGRA